MRKVIGLLMMICIMSCNAHKSPVALVQEVSNDMTGKRVVGYYTNDMASYKEDEIDYEKLTHICHAFLQPNSDGSISIPANYLNSALITNAHNAGVKVLATLGGPMGNNNQIFKQIAASQAACDKLAEDFENICRTYGYDGIDINWEFPESAEEKEGNTRMLKAIKDRFSSSPAPAPKWIICLAVPAGDWFGRWYDYDALNNYVDFYNLMAFPYHGPWSGHSGHNSPLYSGSDMDGQSCDASVLYMLNNRNVPADKINLGLPFYGVRFATSEQLLDDCGGNCAMTEVFFNIIPSMLNSNWTGAWDPASMVPYATNDSGAGIISYDNSQSIGIKVKYVMEEKNLGGVFIWKLGLDEIDGECILLNAVHDAKK